MNKELLKENSVEAAKGVLNIMAGIEIEKEVLVSDYKEIQADITGIIGLSSDNSIKGTICISLFEDLGKRIVANMLMVEPKDVSDEDLKDGIGEIINMIAGDFNNRMNNMFKLSLPSVIKGKKHSVSLTHNGDLMVFKLFVSDSFFFLLTTFEEQNKEG